MGRRALLISGSLPPRPVPIWLAQMLERGLRQALMSEKARSEFIVVPILLATQELSPRAVAIYSGQRLDVDPQHGLVGDMKAPVDVTYLADTVILLRYFEAYGRVRRAISVIKKRTSAHEDTIREFRINSDGFRLGEPLMGFQGVLRGVPELVEEQPRLLEAAAE